MTDEQERQLVQYAAYDRVDVKDRTRRLAARAALAEIATLRKTLEIQSEQVRELQSQLESKRD